MPARGVAAFRTAIRFASAPIIRCCAAVGGSDALRMRHTPCGCRSAHLVEVRSNHRLPPVSTMRRALAMPLFRTQAAAEVTSLAPHGSKARLRVVTTRRGSWRSHVHRTRLRSACSSSSPKLPMCGVEGEGPSSFLSGVAKGDTLFREREYPPLSVQRQALLSPRHQCRSFLCTCAKKRKRKQEAPAGRGEGFLLCCVCIFRREKITSGGAPLCKY